MNYEIGFPVQQYFCEYGTSIIRNIRTTTFIYQLLFIQSSTFETDEYAAKYFFESWFYFQSSNEHLLIANIRKGVPGLTSRSHLELAW